MGRDVAGGHRPLQQVGIEPVPAHVVEEGGVSIGPVALELHGQAEFQPDHRHLVRAGGDHDVARLRQALPAHSGGARIIAAIASDLPAAILADLLGLHVNTAVHWVTYARGDWTDRLTDRAAEQKASHPSDATTSERE
ncbi:hypothetical protein ACWEJ6_48750 [Nonomuraea sp. NPDC004702]